MKLNVPMRTKLFLSHFLAILLVCGTVGAYFYHCAADNLKDSIQSRLKSSAAMLGQMLDAAELNAIRGETDQALPTYHEYLELLRGVRRVNPDIAYLYVMRRTEDRLYFVIDSDETKAQALPGREYLTRVSALLEGFSHPSVDNEIVVDEWGATLSGYAPLRNGEGLYLIGLDMDASEVRNKFYQLRMSGLISLIFGFVLSILLSRFLAGQVTTPITLLISRCKAIAEGNLDEQLKHQTGDEVDGLIDAVNQMSARLSDSNEQRREAQETLKQANEKLESHIVERTQDLRELNERLRKEIDIRSQTMDALGVSEERYRALADLLPQPIIETDTNGNLTFLNRAAFDTFGYLPADFDNGLKLYEIFAAEEGRTITRETDLQLDDEKVSCVEHTARRKDGSMFPACTYFSSIMIEGKPEGLRGIVIDISERKRMEEELLKTQKLESLGILAAGIAHDFNNLLTTIMGSVSLARNLIKSEEKLDKLLSRVERASLQARNLTKQLVSLSTGSAPVRSPFSILRSISDAAELALSGSNVKCSMRLDEQLWPVSCDPGQIHQMVVNLVINSMEAMPRGGLIEIEATNIELESFKVPALRAGKYVKLTVRDFGIGIAKEDLPRIFDPYFSTKQRGAQKGMGLGLTIAYSIARRHDGHISVSSLAGVGTEIDVYLPALDRIPDETRKSPAANASPHRGKVLLMDDDEMVRDLAGQMLTYLGYELRLAEDGAEAIALFKEARAEEHPFDLVILDLTVRAGMGGKEAITALREIDAAVRAIAISGYCDDPVMFHFAEHGFLEAVPKPFQLEELREVLHRVMPKKNA
jgi:two-component system, cell cycle sensor histidine kinase and response regulator CckA